MIQCGVKVLGRKAEFEKDWYIYTGVQYRLWGQYDTSCKIES